MISLTEENYLKAIYHLSEGGTRPVLTNEIAEAMNTRAASVTDMIKRLSGKELVAYEKYHGVTITRSGKGEALGIIRKHRLWETFLVDKLGFSWDEVHEVAEQLEHIQSPLLIEKLDSFLNHPAHDPHGHPIPDRHGRMHEDRLRPLAESVKGSQTTVSSVRDSSPTFLQYLNKIGIGIGTGIEVKEKLSFDGSVEVIVDGRKKTTLSREASENILVKH